MYYIEFRAEGQALKRVDNQIVASDSTGFLYAKFDIDAGWDGLALEAVFEQNGNKYVQVLDKGLCPVPIEVLNAGRFKVWLTGVDSNTVTRATTSSLTIDVLRGPGDDAVNASDPTPTEREQILTIASDAQRIAQDVRDDANEGKFNGEDGKSAYQIALDNGFEGTEEEWLDSLGGVNRDKINAIIEAYLKDNEITGEVDSDEIKKIVEDYLAENPPESEVDTDKVNELIDEALKKYSPTIDEKDPTVPAWAKEPNKPAYTAAEVGADEAGTATAAVRDHDTDAQAHAILRNRISTLDKNKADKTEIPAATSDITNDSGFITNAVSDLVNYYLQDETYTQAEVNALVSAIPKFSIEVVSTLPTTDISNTTIYLKNGGAGEDLYTEYIYVNGKWEVLGSQKVDLTGYATESWVNIQLGSYLKASVLTEAINTALAQAKASGEFDGEQGDPGYTPEIGANGNWWINGVDTGKTALGTVISSVTINEAGHLIVTFTDGSPLDAGLAKGATGPEGKQGPQGEQGIPGGKGDKGDTGDKGADGVSVTHSWNGTTLTVTSASGTSSANLKGATGDRGSDGSDGKSAYQSYRDLGGTLTESEWLAALKGKDGKDGTVQINPLFAESVDWLKANGDTSKVYILPDNFIYTYFYKEGTLAYTNLLPLADTTTRLSSDASVSASNIKEGYYVNYRLNSSGVLTSDTTGMYTTGFMPITHGENIYIKGEVTPTSTYSRIVAFYDSNHNFLGANSNKSNMGYVSMSSGEEYGDGAVKVIKTSNFNATNGASISNCAYFRICTGDFENTIFVVSNTEPNWNAGSTGGYAWYNTGHAFVPADYEDRIDELEDRIDNIGINSASGKIDTDYLRKWETPIYDGNIPTFETEAVKPDKSNDSDRTPNNVYALYDKLMVDYEGYVTKDDLGLCSDGIHHLYRYDIQAPETYNKSDLYNEKKPKAFLMSGIHNEYIAVYGLYYAIEELLSNPDLRPLLRNIHLIVLPCANPYAMAQSVRDNLFLNARGVEIHRNFEVGFVKYETFGDKHYSGDEPLTEPESIAIDNIMKTNTDMAFVLSAHSFSSSDQLPKNNVMWCSAGTKYTCNLACRIIGKISDSWKNRFAGNLIDAEQYGYVSVSETGGSEYRQAAKYGIQGFNMEVSSDFSASTDDDDKMAYSSFGISRYAEVYANVLLTAFGVYDYKDKDKYVKYIKEENANG